VNEMKIKEISMKKEIAVKAAVIATKRAKDAEAHVISLKSQLNESQKIKISMMKEISMAAEVKIKAVKSAKDADAQAASILSQLNESQKMNEMKMKEIHTIQETLSSLSENSLK